MPTWHVITKTVETTLLLNSKFTVYWCKKKYFKFEFLSWILSAPVLKSFVFSNKSLTTTNEHQTNVIVFTTTNEFWQKRAFPMCLNSGASLTCKASCNVVIITLLLCMIHMGLENEKISAIKINHFEAFSDKKSFVIMKTIMFVWCSFAVLRD